MKKIIVLFILSAPLAIAGVSEQKAVAKIVKNLKTADKICEEGAGVFKNTIRAYKGKYCKDPAVAVLANDICKNVPGYNESHCKIEADKVINNPVILEKELKNAVLEVFKVDLSTKVVPKAPTDLPPPLPKAENEVKSLEQQLKEAKEKLKKAPKGEKYDKAKAEVEAIEKALKNIKFPEGKEPTFKIDEGDDELDWETTLD